MVGNRASAGNHEEGPAWPSTYLFNAVLYGAALFRVQPFEMGKRHWSRIVGAGRSPNHDSCFVRNRVFSRVPGLPGPVHPKLRCAGFSDRAPTAGGVPSGGVGAWSSDLSVESAETLVLQLDFVRTPELFGEMASTLLAATLPKPKR